MSRIAYVNGQYLPLDHPAIQIEDRGFQFADGVYEVCEVRDGRLVDEIRHLARLRRSLAELRISEPMDLLPLRVVMREVVRRNRVRAGLVYVQVTRGAAPRSHAFPQPPVLPTIVVTARAADPRAAERARIGISVRTMPDQRWARVDIKSIALLANVLAKQAAVEEGDVEAWLVDKNGLVSEGALSNAWIVTADGTLVTAPNTAPILEGITRGIVADTATRLGLKFEQRQFSVAEAIAAGEAFVTSATAIVTPVVRIDGETIGNGTPGPTSMALRQALWEHTTLAPLLALPVA